MKLKKSNAPQRELVPAGSHAARLYQVIDLGTQKDNFDESKEKSRLFLRWEIPNELTEDGRPLSIGKEYTSSTHEKATIVQDITSWFGKAPDDDFDVKTLLGKECMLSVVHEEGKDGKTYDKVKNVSASMKGMEVPNQINESVLFDLDDFDEKVFMSLSSWLKGKIEKSPEYKAFTEPQEEKPKEEEKPDKELDDEVPF